MNKYPVAQINLSALRHNLARVRHFAPQSKVISVIKADAYGHGVVTVATALIESDAFAVARLEEGIALREAGIQHPIMLLEGVFTADEFEIAAQNQLSPVFHHVSQIEHLIDLELSQPLTFCWLMMDTGMHRLGIKPEHAMCALEMLESSANITGDIGLMSHFANADVIGDPRNLTQLNYMKSIQQQTGLEVCLANSAAVVTMPESHYEWVRPGLMLYGISPFAEHSASDLGLQPVMQLKTRLIAIYPISEGDQVGYGGDWAANGPTRIGVASIGYGDGYSRQLSNRSKVLIKGRLAEVIGRVSMDTICINLNDFDDVQTGDEVLLWGAPSLTVESVAEQAQTIPYELVTVICQRVTRESIDGKS